MRIRTTKKLGWFKKFSKTLLFTLGKTAPITLHATVLVPIQENRKLNIPPLFFWLLLLGKLAIKTLAVFVSLHDKKFNHTPASYLITEPKK